MHTHLNGSAADREPGDASLADFVQSFRRQSRRFYAWVAVMSGVTVVVVGLMVLVMPAQDITTLTFRLRFPGADEMTYPDGTEFSPSEIVSGRILTEVFEDNDLGRFQDFGGFAGSFFLIQSDLSYLAIQAEYRSKMAEPGLDAVERDQLERQYKEKLKSVSNPEFALSYTAAGAKRLPKELVPKIQQDLLKTWSDYAITERGVRKHDILVPSTKQVSENVEAGALAHPVVILDKMRLEVVDLQAAVNRVRAVPGAANARTADGGSLEEVRATLDEVRRFELGPQLDLFKRVGTGSHDSEAIHWVSAQIEYNERQRQVLMAQQRAVLEAYSTYVASDHPGQRVQSERSASTGETSSGRSEAITPQVDDSFLDRVVDLANSSADREYRQALVNEAKKAGLQLVSYDAEARYYTDLLNELRKPKTDVIDENDIQELREKLNEARTRVLKAVEQINQIYDSLEKDLNAGHGLYLVTGPVKTVRSRPVPLLSIIVGAFVFFVILLPVLAFILVIRDRVEMQLNQEPNTGKRATGGT